MIYKILLPFLIIALLVVLWFGGGGAFLKSKLGNTQNKSTTTSQSPIPATESPSVSDVEQKSNIPTGWKIYSNSQYNFEISYPANYKVLTSKDDLYGWPDAILLLYGGGQAYDVAIEVWDTEAEYKAKYPGVSLAVYSINGKFITISDQTLSEDNKTIIQSFQLTN
jgi:hypothetical protein